MSIRPSKSSYTSHTLVRKSDYNLFVTGSADGTYNTESPNAGIIWGLGYGRYGYGQNLEFIAPVQKGQLIKSQEWDNLDAVLSDVLDHQLGPNTYEGLPGSQIQAGQLITPIPSFIPHVVTAFHNVGKTYATVDDPVRTVSYSGYWGNTGATTLKFIQNIEFASANAARYFFNAGGKFKLSFNNSPAVATPRNSLWSRICSGAGVVSIGYQNTTKTDGSGAASRYFALNHDDGGFWAHDPNNNLVLPTVLHFKQFDPNSSPYGYGYGYYGTNNLDYLKVEMIVSDTDGLNDNPGKTLSIITSLVNGSVLTPSSQDEISGTVDVHLTVSRPSTVYLPVDTWSPYSYINPSASAV